MYKKEKIICEFEMDQYKKFHCLRSNLSNDDIKLNGMDFRGHRPPENENEF